MQTGDCSSLLEAVTVGPNWDSKSRSRRNRIRFLSSSGQEIPESELQSLTGMLVLKPDEFGQLLWTGKRCIFAPEQQGTIHIVNQARHETLSFVWENSATQPTLSEMRMVHFDWVGYALGCHWPNPLVGRNLRLDWDIEGIEDILGLDLLVDLVPMESSGKSATRLFRKSIGEPKSKIPDSVSLENFEPGTYLAKVMGRHIVDGLEALFEQLTWNECVRCGSAKVQNHPSLAKGGRWLKPDPLRNESDQ